MTNWLDVDDYKPLTQIARRNPLEGAVLVQSLNLLLATLKKAPEGSRRGVDDCMIDIAQDMLAASRKGLLP